MDENTILKNFSKKAKFFLLYDIILIMILFVLIIFAYLSPNFYNSNQNDDLDNSIDLNLIVDSNSGINTSLDVNVPELVLEIVYAGDSKNCGDNINCFKTYSADCNKDSRFVFIDEIKTEDRIFTRTTEYTIFGIEYIYCKVNVSISDLNVEYKETYKTKLKEDGIDDSNISSSLLAENNTIKKNISKNGYCYYSTPQDLIDYLDKLDQNKLEGGINCFYADDNSAVCSSSGDWSNITCGGDYFFIDYNKSI
jgi:hypothetical protein